MLTAHRLEPPEKQESGSCDSFQHALHGWGGYPRWWVLLPPPGYQPGAVTVPSVDSRKWCFSNHGIHSYVKYRGFGADFVGILIQDPSWLLSLDRKAVISQGMLKCLGSSLFLKSKWGIGYRLRYYFLCDTCCVDIIYHFLNCFLLKSVRWQPLCTDCLVLSCAGVRRKALKPQFPVFS